MESGLEQAEPRKWSVSVSSREIMSGYKAAEAREAGREQAQLLSRPWLCSSQVF